MANSIYGLTNYYNLFKSPLSPVQASPLANLMYGSIAGGIYSQTVARNAQSTVSSYLASMAVSVGALKVSAKPLSIDAPSSSMNKKAVTASDSIAITGTANWNADAKTYGITVSKLAAGQSNKGSELKSDGASAINQGLNRILIKSNGVVKTASFTVNAGDTNKTALGRMAAGINNANAGVKASVVSDTKTGMSYLKLDSVNTGSNSSFSISDETGNALSATGAGMVQTQAQNAEYALDGKQYTSQSNSISINNGKVQITLNKADNKEVRLTVGSDVKAVENDIKSFISNYNNIIGLSGRYSGRLSGAAMLGSELEGIINARKVSLTNIGITVGSDNTLQVDETKLGKAIASNPSYVREIFSGSDGIAGKVYTKANEIMSSPAKYSQSNLFTSDYTNYMNTMLTQSVIGNSGSGSLYRGLVFDLFL